MPHILDPLTLPLYGSRLIEASAGTGKTWTIAALYVRLVLGHGPGPLSSHGHGQNSPAGRPLLPPDVLVMTFTRAATRELVERIRARLVQAAASFRAGAALESDPFLAALLQHYRDADARSQAAWRLDVAAQCMDEASIFTIDAWCQRVLREHAVDSDSLLDDTQLLPDTTQLLTTAVQDYWRQHCYPLSDALLEAVSARWDGPMALLRDITAVLPALESGAKLETDGAGEVDASSVSDSLGQSLQAARQRQREQLQQFAQDWQHIHGPALTQWLHGHTPEGKKSVFGLGWAHLRRWLDVLESWAQQPDTSLAERLGTGAQRLTPEGLREKLPADVDVPPAAHALQAILDALSHNASEQTLWTHAVQHITRRLHWLKTQNASFGFADMLHRLDAALRGPQGEALAQRLRQQYPVALIDEFQDTSALQYRVFDRIYRIADNSAATALLLIGDPKQSIYAFRGADIHSYLYARRATEGRHYVLDTNYRSSAAVVQAVNAWFERAERRSGAGAFMYRRADAAPDAASPLPFAPVQARGRREVFMQDGQPAAAMHIVWQAALPDANGAQTLNAETLRQHLAHACAQRIVQWLNAPDTGFVSADGPCDTGAVKAPPLQRVRPGDIAVLVRTGTEAEAIAHALHRCAVPSVYLSQRASVFASSMARDLLYWLHAVAHPLDYQATRAALATHMCGLPLSQLVQLHDDDQQLDAWSEQFHHLHRIWQRQGVLAMLRQSLHRLQLPRRWLHDEGSTEGTGERRLTDYLHLAELLQNASATLEGEQALLRWLAERIAACGQSSDEQILRLESDAQLVQIVTIHKSKGLEYPIVCLPFASLALLHRPLSGQPLLQSVTDATVTDATDGPPERRLLLHYDQAQVQAADNDRLREDLRLFYVALTRARHALWLGTGPQRRGRDTDCIAHRSASGYLLAGDVAQTPQQWVQHLHALAQHAAGQVPAGQPAPITVQLLAAIANDSATPEPVAVLHRLQFGATLRPMHIYRAEFDRRWTIASFSALVRDMAGEIRTAPLATAGSPSALTVAVAESAHLPVNSSGDAPPGDWPYGAGMHALVQAVPLPPHTALHTPRRADDEGIDESEAPTLWVSMTQEKGGIPAFCAPTAVAVGVQPEPPSAIWHCFPKGRHTGNLLHGLLQWLAQEDFALPPPAQCSSPASATHKRNLDRIVQQLIHAGHSPEQARAALPWLCAIVHHRLMGPGCTLHETIANLPEMEFWLPAAHLQAEQVDTLCRAHILTGQPRAPLPQRSLHGMLMGFADLVFCHAGRYWVLDYKTNHLGEHDSAYSADALSAAMLHHRYDVQAVIYLLALHRLLRLRLGAAYRPETMLGGALYYFVRGIHGSGGAVHTIAATADVVAMLDTLLQSLGGGEDADPYDASPYGDGC